MDGRLRRLQTCASTDMPDQLLEHTTPKLVLLERGVLLLRGLVATLVGTQPSPPAKMTCSETYPPEVCFKPPLDWGSGSVGAAFERGAVPLSFLLELMAFFILSVVRHLFSCGNFSNLVESCFLFTAAMHHFRPVGAIRGNLSLPVLFHQRKPRVIAKGCNAW